MLSLRFVWTGAIISALTLPGLFGCGKSETPEATPAVAPPGPVSDRTAPESELKSESASEPALPSESEEPPTSPVAPESGEAPTEPSLPPPPPSAPQPAAVPATLPQPPPPPEPSTPPPSEAEMAALWRGPGERPPPSDADLAALRREVERNPGSADAHYRLGHALQRRGEKEEALKEFREALRLEPQHSPAKKALNQARQG